MGTFLDSEKPSCLLFRWTKSGGARGRCPARQVRRWLSSRGIFY